jgi:hypothetical protein
MNFTPAEIMQAAALATGMLGTGAWLGLIIRNHEKRIQNVEKAIPSKLDEEKHDREAGERRLEVINKIEALEDDMPSELRKRLRNVENEKLGITEHAAICATAMRNIETQVSSINRTIEEHAGRLATGDKLFLDLQRLAGKMEQALEIEVLKNKKGGP